MIFDDADIKKIVKAILAKHILPDIIGNLRAFSSQTFRCKKCGKTYRRPLLNERCFKCGGDLTQTVHPKNVIKYLDIGRTLLKYVKDDHYLTSRFNLLEKEIRQTITGISRQVLTLSDFI
jgi:DNA polymerase II large subunit